MESNRWPRNKPHTHSHLVFDKGNKYTHEDSILTNSTAKIHVYMRTKPDPCTKLNIKWLTDSTGNLAL